MIQRVKAVYNTLWVNQHTFCESTDKLLPEGRVVRPGTACIGTASSSKVGTVTSPSALECSTPASQPQSGKTNERSRGNGRLALEELLSLHTNCSFSSRFHSMNVAPKACLTVLQVARQVFPRLSLSLAVIISTTKVSVRTFLNSLAGGPFSPDLLANRVPKSNSMIAPQRWA